MEVLASVIAWLSIPMWGDKGTRRLWFKIAIVFFATWFLMENSK